MTVDKYINNANEIYEDITIDKYVIMPNHVHLLITIDYSNGRQRAASPTISDIVKGIKSLTKKYTGEDLFQRSFHDHIIRDRADYLKIWEYIDTNPLKWHADCFYSDE